MPRLYPECRIAAASRRAGKKQCSRFRFLIGMYLALEKGHTGRQVQRAHTRIAKARKDWPRLEPPVHPADLTVREILQTKTGAERESMIHRWMVAVWESWADRKDWVREITSSLLF